MPNQPTRKSDRTRARILAAARELFGEHGFDGVSLRDIAGQAGADPALLIRYFQSKDRLFAGAAEIDLRLPELTGARPEDVGRILAAHFVETWEAPRTGTGLRVLLRSAPTQKETAERMRAIFTGQVMPAIRAVDRSGASDWKAAIIASQVLGFALTRYILELPAMTHMPGDELARHLGRLIQTILDSERITDGNP
jgi:AcrR family transcriptional regulator